MDINDPKNSITKETFDKFVDDTSIGIGVTDIASSTGTMHTVHTEHRSWTQSDYQTKY